MMRDHIVVWCLFCIFLYHHQNTKLLFDCFCSDVKNQLKKKADKAEDKNVEVPKFDIMIKDLMAMAVCHTINLKCMVHCCKNCPGYPALEKFIRIKFTELEIYEDMSCSQWESVSRTTLRHTQLMVDDFIQLLVYSFDNLKHTPSSQIAKPSISNRGKKK